MDLGKIIAFNLKELRTERNLTLGQLSKITGLSKAMLADMEKGGTFSPFAIFQMVLIVGLLPPFSKIGRAHV